MYTIGELRNMATDELHKELLKTRRDLYQERTAQAIGQSKTPHRKKVLKKYIVHLLTVINNRTS